MVELVEKPEKKITAKKSLMAVAPAHFTEDGILTTLPILLPALIKEFSLSYTLAGSLGFAFRAASAATNPFLGMLSEKVGRRRLFLLAGVGCACMFLSLVSLAPSFIFIVLFVAASGVGTALYHPQALTMLKEVTKKSVGSVVGIHGAIGGIGMVMSPLILSYIMVTLGWRYAVPLLFVPIFLVSIPLVWRYMVEPPKGQGMKPTFKRLGGRMFLVILAYEAVNAAALTGLRFFLPVYLTSGKGLDLATAGIVFSLTGISSLIGLPLGGFCADRFNRKLLLIGIPITYAASYFLFIQISSPLPAWVALLFIARTISAGIYPIMISILSEVPNVQLTTAIAIMEGTTSALGATAPLVMGVVADFFGLVLAMQILLVPAFILVGLAMFLPGKSKAALQP